MLFNIKCPACHKERLKVNFHKHKIKFFGEVMESILNCKCSYRHVDVMILSEKDSVKYTLNISDDKDMLIRVVRSGNSTIEIPEIGVKITPGTGSEGYITNIEGIIKRIEDILLTLSNGEDKDKVKLLLDKIEKIKKGEKTAKLIIEDPSGNSVIISDKAIKEPYNEIKGS